jgi:hypothetical protein
MQMSITANAAQAATVAALTGGQPSVSGLGIGPAASLRSQSINTRLWTALSAFNQEHGDTELVSTAVPSVAEETHPTGLEAMHEQRHGREAMGPPLCNSSSQDRHVRADAYSATEVDTPSFRGTPDLLNTSIPPTVFHESRPAQGRSNMTPTRTVAQNLDFFGRPRLPSNSQEAGAGVMLSLREIENTIQDYGRRISTLESMSFSHMPSEEVQDKLDLVDARLIDLEVWRTDMDKERPSPEPEKPESPQCRRLLPTESGSFASDGSFDSNAAAQTEAVVLATLAASAEVRPRIDALEYRIMELENMTMPSFVRPWQLQVVLLPFGRELPGIWYSAADSVEKSLHSLSRHGEWTGPRPAAQTSFRSTTSSIWTTESISAWAHGTSDEWLSPKACGPSGVVFQRLASRGLVRDVLVQSPDAGHILKVISEAFGDVLDAERMAPGEKANQFRGLEEQFIPLRKVRKSSRLRFLSPAEMVTPAMWTAEFLEASVFMKVDDHQRRLYMTTSEAYTQPEVAGWTWPTLRQIPLVDANGKLQVAQYAGRVIESCWTYHERLDHVDRLDASFADQESVWSTRSQSSARSAIDHKANDKLAVRKRSSLEFENTRRSVSMPSVMGPAEARPSIEASLFKRRMASNESMVSSAAALERPVSAASNAAKRRRVSASSEQFERRIQNFTPRFSREPSVPCLAQANSHHQIPATTRSQHYFDNQHNQPVATASRGSTSSSHKRGITPTAYATPHSHLEYARADDLDTEFYTERLAARTDTDDRDDGSDYGSEDDDLEEWEGVQDGTGPDDSHIIASTPHPSATRTINRRSSFVHESRREGDSGSEEEEDYDDDDDQDDDFVGESSLSE